MSYLARIQSCNRYHISDYIPLIIDNEHYGWLNERMRQLLKGYPEVFVFHEHVVTLNPSLVTYQQRTAAVEAVNQDLVRQGYYPDWIDERYPVSTEFDAVPVMDVGRAANSSYGFRAYGTHVNGLVGGGSELSVWIATRSRSRPHYPGMLDHIVAGGLPMGLSPMENVIKECDEEAGIPETVAANAKFIREIRYCEGSERGLKRDTIFCFDLHLPESFEPRNTDGEVEQFELWTLEELAERVISTEDFKPNCNLVIIDLLIRKGVIKPDHPEYQELVNGLSPDFPEIKKGRQEIPAGLSGGKGG